MDKDRSEKKDKKPGMWERREKALDELFGEDRKEYMGNIWGWRFSGISFVGLLLVGGLTMYGVYSGNIDIQRLNEEGGERVFESTKSPHQDSIQQKK